jgi:hypothetical protein
VQVVQERKDQHCTCTTPAPAPAHLHLNSKLQPTLYSCNVFVQASTATVTARQTVLTVTVATMMIVTGVT